MLIGRPDERSASVGRKGAILRFYGEFAKAIFAAVWRHNLQPTLKEFRNAPQG
jgi:hypothetical protein